MCTSVNDTPTEPGHRQALLKRILWDAYDMAEFLGLSVHSIRRVVHASPVGFPSALFLGGKWIWRSVEVQRWAEGEYIQPYTPPPPAEPPALTMRGRGRPRGTIESLGQLLNKEQAMTQASSAFLNVNKFVTLHDARENLKV